MITIPKYTQYQLNKMEAIDIYKLVLRGDIKKFPNGFWQRPDYLQNAEKVTKFLIEDILKWNDEKIKANVNVKFFTKAKLGGMINQAFENSPYKAINNLYPNKFKPWDLSVTPNSYWTLETGIYATRWLIEEKLQWTDEDIKTKLTNHIFNENGLRGMLSVVFNSSHFKAINTAYPNKFKPWELIQVPINYWNLETAREATKWLIEDKLKWNDEDIKNKLTARTLKDNNLCGMLEMLFNSSVYRTLDNAYPNKYKPWNFNQVSRNYWNKETGKTAVKWLLEDKLKWTDNEIKEQLTFDIFCKYELRGMLAIVFNSSIYDALNYTYPNRFKLWEISRVPTTYWTNDTIKEATKWLIEDKLKWNDEEIKKNINIKIFQINGLGGLLRIFNNSTFKALDNTYPGKFKKGELRSYFNSKTMSVF